MSLHTALSDVPGGETLSLLCPAVVGVGLPVQPVCGLAQTPLWLLPEHGIFVSQTQALLQLCDPCTGWGLSFHAEQHWNEGDYFQSGDLHLVSHRSPALPLLIRKHCLSSSHQLILLMGLLVVRGE